LFIIKKFLVFEKVVLYSLDYIYVELFVS